MLSYINAFKNYAKCDGRANRKEFWLFTLFHYIFLFVFALLDAYFELYPSDYIDYGWISIFYILISACPNICLQVRRLHDVGKSGSWWFVRNVPILNFYCICI